MRRSISLRRCEIFKQRARSMTLHISTQSLSLWRVVATTTTHYIFSPSPEPVIGIVCFSFISLRFYGSVLMPACLCIGLTRLTVVRLWRHYTASWRWPTTSWQHIPYRHDDSHTRFTGELERAACTHKIPMRAPMKVIFSSSFDANKLRLQKREQRDVYRKSNWPKWFVRWLEIIDKDEHGHITTHNLSHHVCFDFFRLLISVATSIIGPTKSLNCLLGILVLLLLLSALFFFASSHLGESRYSLLYGYMVNRSVDINYKLKHATQLNGLWCNAYIFFLTAHICHHRTYDMWSIRRSYTCIHALYVFPTCDWNRKQGGG